jgi:hypothetical protein
MVDLLVGKVLSNEIVRSVMRMLLYLFLALAFICTKLVLSKAVHWAVPGDGGTLLGVFDSFAEVFLIAPAIVIVCCGAFDVTWVVVIGTIEGVKGDRHRVSGANDDRA